MCMQRIREAQASPQHEALHDKVELAFVAVSEPGPLPPYADVQGVAGLEFCGLEVVLHVVDDSLDGVTVEQQEGVVVGDAVQAVQNLLLPEITTPIPAAHTVTSQSLWMGQAAESTFGLVADTSSEVLAHLPCDCSIAPICMRNRKHKNAMNRSTGASSG